jgi:hypothetical protein
LGPIPLFCKICGVWTVPAEMITSLFALTVIDTSGLLLAMYSTPTAVVPSNSTFLTLCIVTTWKFGREMPS